MQYGVFLPKQINERKICKIDLSKRDITFGTIVVLLLFSSKEFLNKLTELIT